MEPESNRASDMAPAEIPVISSTGHYVILVTAFLGWMFAGVQLAVSSLVMRDAAKNLLETDDEALIGQWFGWLIVSFLLGAASGGYLFGWIGDRMGRAKAMALSILCYSIFAGLTFFVQHPLQLLILRFVTCMGVGGMWPNGIALISEAWPNVSRPILAGVIGTAANVGIMLFSTLACFVFITPDDWRWTMLMGACPIVLAVIVLVIVPESPRWLALRGTGETAKKHSATLTEVFRPPMLRRTVFGILLGTIPLFGGWNCANWANAWSSQVGDQAKHPDSGMEDIPTRSDPGLKGRVLLARSAPGSLSSLLGGALAMWMGRRRCYLFLSCAAFGCAQYLFWFSHPGQIDFLVWTGALGLFSGFFFGWLPLCLPEMFPTRVRSTGAGVSFNFGRILTAFGILVAAGLLKDWFDGDYAQIGRATSLIYLAGVAVIALAPDTSKTDLEDSDSDR